MISRHNGREYCFDVYSHKIDGVYGRWNEDGTENKYVDFETVFVGEEPTGELDENGVEIMRKIPYRAYYKETKEYNSVTIQIEVRKHNKTQYFDAVKSQLMYLRDDIVFHERYGDTWELIQNVPFKAEILYEDDLIIIPKTSYYSRPHFVIKNICYGVIEYNEMDLALKQGSVGVKFQMEKLEVTPNREGVIYRNKTRASVLENDKALTKLVESKIQETLKTTDFIDWVRSCNNIMISSKSSDAVITRIANLIDKSQIKPKFNNVRYNPVLSKLFTDLFDFEKGYKVTTRDYRKGKDVSKVNRVAEGGTSLLNLPIYIVLENLSGKVNTYLGYKHEHGFALLRIKQAFEPIKEEIREFLTTKDYTLEKLKGKVNDFLESEYSEDKRDLLEGTFEEFYKILPLIKGNDKVKLYSEVVVPEDFKEEDLNGLSEEEIEDEEEKEKARKEKYKKVLELRKQDGKIITHRLCLKGNFYNYVVNFTKVETKISDLASLDNLIYGDTEDSSDLMGLGELQKSTRSFDRYSSNFIDIDGIQVHKLSKTNVKKVKDIGTYVPDYILGIDENGILRSNALIRNIINAKFIKPMIQHKCLFLNKFDKFSQKTSTEFREMCDFIREYDIDNLFVKGNQSSLITFVFELSDRYNKLLIKGDLKDSEVQELIDNTVKEYSTKCPYLSEVDILGIDLLDMEFVEKVKRYIELDNVYGSILNHIGPLSNPKSQVAVSYELENEIKHIIDSRKDQLVNKFEGIND